MQEFKDIDQHPGLLDFIQYTDTKVESNLMCFHQGELYICQSKRIRLINIREWKRTSTNPKVVPTFKNLIIPGFDFDPIGLFLNDQGRYLCILGTKKVLVVMTPLSKSELVDIQCTSFVIGKRYYGNDSFHVNKSCIWHHLSNTQSHLMILSSNGIVRMFDLVTDVDEPEQIFHFCDMEQPKVGFSPNLEEFEVVSFFLPPYTGPDCGWSHVTLFGLLCSGDIVSICPVVPNESTISIAWTQSTLESTVALWKNTTDRFEKTLYYWTRTWLQNILDQESNGLVIKRPLTNMTLVKSSNWLFQPKSEIIDSLNGLASDVVVIPTNSLPIINVGYSNGMIITGIPSSDLRPCWYIDEYQPELQTKLMVYQVLQLEQEKDSVIRMYHDLVTPDTLYVTTQEAVFQIQLSLYKFMHDTELEIQVEESHMRRLIEMDSNTLQGFVIISDVILGLGYLLLTKNDIIGQELYPIIQYPNKTTEQEHGYNSILKPYDYTIEPITIKETISQGPSYPDFITVGDIQTQVNIMQNKRSKIQSIMNQSIQLTDRISLLQTEHQLQNIVLESHSKTMQRLQEKVPKQKERINRLLEQIETSKTKASHLLELLHDMTQPRLSSQEISWFQDLSRLLLLYQNSFTDKLQTIQHEFSKVNDSITEQQDYDDEILGTNQLRNVKQNLHHEYHDLSQLAKRMESLQLELKNIQ